MSVLEGHGNRVMNELGRIHVAGQDRMARVLDSRRRTRGMQSILHKLFGLDAKMRQYEVGEAFVAAVENEAGPRGLDPAWRGPEWLPTVDELSQPRAWLDARRRGRLRPPPCRPSTGHPTSGVSRRGGTASWALDGVDAPVVVGVLGRRRLAWRCSRSRSTAASGPSPCTSTTASAAASAGEAEFVAACAASLGAPSTRSASSSTPGPNLEARAHAARYEALDRAAGGDRRDRGARRAHGRRPGRDGAAQPPARERERRARRDGGSGAATSSGRCSRYGAPTRSPCARRSGSNLSRIPMNDDLAHQRVWIRHEVLPLLAAGAGRDLVPVLARQAEILRSESEELDRQARRGVAGRRRRRRARSPRFPSCSPAGRCARGSAAPVPSFAEVERVLEVARGAAREACSSPVSGR